MLSKSGVKYVYRSDRLTYFVIPIDGKYCLTCAQMLIFWLDLDLGESATEQQIKNAASSVIRIAAEAIIKEVSE